MNAPRAALVLGFCLTTAATAHAQFPRHGLTAIHPAGGQAGSTVSVDVAGTEIDGSVQLVFDHPGIRAFRVKGPKFSVAIAPNVPPGQHDARLSGPLGLSNPRIFEIGDRPEALEIEPNNTPEAATPTALGATIRGRIEAPSDIDAFAFEGRKGQFLVIEIATQSIDSQLDAAFRLLGPSGRLLVGPSDLPGPEPVLAMTLPEDGRYVFQVHDLVYAGSPERGYRLTIREGPRLDAVVPVPPDGASHELFGRDGRGKLALPESGLIAAPRAFRPSHRAAIGGRSVMIRPPGRSAPTNAIFDAAPVAPIIAEVEPNDAPEKAQTLSPPCEVVAGFDAPGDVDAFRFSARKGDVWQIEVLAERLGTNVDAEFSVARIAAPDKPLTAVLDADDMADPFGGKRFPIGSPDPSARFVAPEDGAYLVRVRDRDGSPLGASETLPYRLRIRPERPDFRLYLVPRDPTNPEAMTLRAGGRASAYVLADRRDGLQGPIRVEARNIPSGVTCDPIVIPSGQTIAPVVFSADSGAPIVDGSASLIGRNLSPDRKDVLLYAKMKRLERESEQDAVPGALVWPAPAGNTDPPAISRARTTSAFALAVREGAPFRLTATPASAVVAAGGSVEIKVSLERRTGFTEAVQVTAADLPSGLPAPAAVTIAKDRTEAVVTLKVPKAMATGPYTILLRGGGPFPFSKDPAAKQKPPITVDEPANVLILTVTP